MGNVAAPVVAELLQEFASLAISPQDVCRAVGLDHARLHERGFRVSRQAYGQLFLEAERLSGDPLVGLHAAETRGARCMLAMLTMVQPTLGAGIAQFARFAGVVDEQLLIRLERGPQTSAVRLRIELGDPRASAHASEYLVALLVQLYRDATKQPFQIQQVSFPHALRGDASEYERVVGAPVSSEGRACVITLPTSALDSELRRSNASVADLLGDAARLELAQDDNSAFRSRVEQVTFEMYQRSGTDSHEEVARLLAVSGRTLQRRLREEGTSYREVRDSVRQQWSSRLLRDGSLSISEVSARVGFSDVAAFDKAFKRWFGETPSGFRNGSQRSAARAVGRRDGTAH
jgi:AraC-like DNA-binding protein